MKKFIASFLILLCLLSSMIGAIPRPTTNVFKEGVYRLSNLENLPISKIFYVQNVSLDKEAYLVVYDNNFVALQALKLEAQSIKYNLVPLKSDYRIALIGDGEIYIS